ARLRCTPFPYTTLFRSVFKFIPDAASRVAEIESGSSDVTLEIPYEEFDRLKEKGFTGYATPISDIAMIFINDVDPMLDKNVRLRSEEHTSELQSREKLV